MIWISCTLEGRGTAWFDDLELVAYDRKNLPEDFETRFGPSNLPAEFSVLARRIGTWDTQTTIKPGLRITDGLKSTGVETVEWVLGKKLIQSKHKQQPGNVEALSLLAYDTQFDVFRSFTNSIVSRATVRVALLLKDPGIGGWRMRAQTPGLIVEGRMTRGNCL